jgi:TRAP-type mannitol/chloroaromatic compound transport system permease large subunit
MAPAIFYLRAVAPAEINIKHMYKGVVPFIVLQCLTLVFVMIFPSLVTYLPSIMLNFN